MTAPDTTDRVGKPADDHPLKVARTRARVSRSDLAALSGVSLETIGRIERRSHRPQRSTLLALAIALNVAPSSLEDVGDAE